MLVLHCRRTRGTYRVTVISSHGSGRKLEIVSSSRVPRFFLVLLIFPTYFLDHLYRGPAIISRHARTILFAPVADAMSPRSHKRVARSRRHVWHSRNEDAPRSPNCYSVIEDFVAGYGNGTGSLLVPRAPRLRYIFILLSFVTGSNNARLAAARFLCELLDLLFNG